MAMGISELNHLDNEVIQAGLACLILESGQIPHSFGFKLHQAVLWSHGILQSLLEGFF
jgi:hypothetical protein